MKHLFRITLLTLSILFITSIFPSCSQKEYNSTLSCKELSKGLEREISVPQGQFKEYTSDELDFLFSTPKLYDDICIVYSTDSTDVCELGVLHASSKENAKKLLEDTKGYIKSMQEQKSEFLRNYSPAELTKLNSAEARCFGEYIVFTVADPYDRDEAFKKAEMILSK